MTVEKRPRQFLAVWSDDGKSVKGSTFEESFFVDGAFWKNEQSKVPLDGFEAFGEMFSSGLQAQHDQLVDDNARLASELEAKATECDTANAALEKLAADMEKLVAAHKAALDAKQAELDAANTTIANQNSAVSNQAGTINQLQANLAEKEALITSKNNQLDTLAAAINTQVDLTKDLQAKIDTLKQNQRFDPRQINALAFYARITKDEFARLAASPDPQLTSIAQAILAYAANEKIWPVVFDSPEMQGMVGYMMQVGELTQERVNQLTADATWQEAFYAPV